MQKIREAFLNSNPESKIKAYTVIVIFLLSITGLMFILAKYIDLSKFSYSKNNSALTTVDNNINVFKTGNGKDHTTMNINMYKCDKYLFLDCRGISHNDSSIDIKILLIKAKCLLAFKISMPTTLWSSAISTQQSGSLSIVSTTFLSLTLM